MANRIQHLLFSDEDRLPLLGLLPRSSELTGVESKAIKLLHAALRARFESAKKQQDAFYNAEYDATEYDATEYDSADDVSNVEKASGDGSLLQHEMDVEVAMLQSALDWLVLQEER